MSDDPRVERWRRIEELYHAAVSLPAAERAALLHQACGGDLQLRQEIDALLCVAQDAECFLEPKGVVVVDETHSTTGSLAGRRVGAYQVGTLLGAGGMGEVYLARDTKLARDVAIKVLPGMFTTDPDRLARFEREARVLGALNHPHIGAIYGLEESDGVRGLVLEFVEGATLAERLAAGPLPVDSALPIARQIVDALEAAHEKGIVHRDLKPANIKITTGSIVKVLDFGLARVIGGEEPGPDLSRSPTMTVGGTRKGLLLGTAAYMSPEQARGLVVDKRTDIWAFGCVLYEMLTGRQAFGGDTLTDTLAAIVGRAPDWRALPAATPQMIHRLLKRCLEKDPTRRLRDIGDARIDIEEALAIDGQSKSSAVVSPQSAWLWRPVALVSVGVLLVGLVAFRFAMNVNRETATAWSTARIIPTRLTSYGGTEAGAALSPDGRSFVFVSDHGGTPDIWLRQVSGGEPIRLTNDAAEETDLIYAPDGDTIYFTRTDAGGPAIWRMGALGGQARKVLGNARRPAPSPDGRSLAYYEPDGNLFALTISTLQGNEKRTLVRGILGGIQVIRPAWSPDSRWISYCQYGLFAPRNLFVVDARTAQMRQVTHFIGSPEGIDQHAWLPDNRHLVVSYVPFPRQMAPSDLGILDIRDGSISRLTMNIDQGLGAPSLSRDGTRLIATASQIRREVWKVPLGPNPVANGRAAVRLMDSTQDPMWTFASRDGRTLLFNGSASGSRNLWTMPLDGSARPRQITAVSGDAIAHSSLSPDGARVAFASIASGASHIWIQDIDGTELRQLTHDAAAADAWPVWSPDGRWIAFNSVREGREETWGIAAVGGRPEKLFDGFFRGDWVRQPTGSGTWLVSSVGGGLRLFDVEQRRVMWEWHHADRLSLPVFSPDGRFISLPLPESRDRDAIWVIEAATGTARIVVQFPEAFRMYFRAGWVDNGQAFIVNRYETLSHIVLLDQFWARAHEQ